MLTFGLALFFLPPLYPFVAFFYNGLTVSGRQNGDARHAGDGSRNAHARHRRAGPVHQCGRPGGAVLCQLVLPPIFLVSLVDGEKRCLHDIIAGVVIVRRLDSSLERNS